LLPDLPTWSLFLFIQSHVSCLFVDLELPLRHLPVLSIPDWLTPAKKEDSRRSKASPSTFFCFFVFVFFWAKKIQVAVTCVCQNEIFTDFLYTFTSSEAVDQIAVLAWCTALQEAGFWASPRFN